mmetsp:Transcript_424/g.1578  ORF Transcript_424/g.1578 Transcript_424/m.1578 type:complete len:111 (-) Transcript_424:255-587(-)
MASLARKLLPLADRVLIKRVVAATATSGGILLPASAVKEKNEGEVVAVGPGARSSTTGDVIPMSVSIGDKVLLPEYGGKEVLLGADESEDKFFLYHQDEILGVFDKTERE